MTIAAVLLAYTVGVATLGARMLARASWTARAPLLAIITYLAAAWSVVAALGLVGLTLAVHATALGGALSQLIGACVLRLRATYATPGGAAVAGAGLILAGAIAVRTALTAASHLRSGLASHCPGGAGRRRLHLRPRARSGRSRTGPGLGDYRRGAADPSAAAPGRTARQVAAAALAGCGRGARPGTAGHGAGPGRARARTGTSSSRLRDQRSSARSHTNGLPCLARVTYVAPG